MKRFTLTIAMLLTLARPVAADPPVANGVRDLYFGEALFYALQEDWFDAIARLDAELAQHYRVDEPERDSLYPYRGQAEFGVGDFELAYRMHQRAGRAITKVIEANVDEPIRNDALYRMARLYFQKNQPREAHDTIERIRGVVPLALENDLAFLRAQIFMANGRFAEAVTILRNLRHKKGFEGFGAYNLGIALIKVGKEREGREYLDRVGQLSSDDEVMLALKDKANLVLGSKLLDDKDLRGAKSVFDRVRLAGPFSNRALLGSGWADAFAGRYEEALAPWSVLVGRAVTDTSVQEGMLAAPYAYAKLNVHSRAAVLYGSALEHFTNELNKLEASIQSIREGHFLRALVRDEVTHNPDWVVALRTLPQSPETYYLLDLMASHDFQSSLKNYLDLERLRRRLEVWSRDLDAFEDLIATRRAYYQKMLPGIDRHFRRLDSLMRLRVQQREHIGQRLAAMLQDPRPDYLTTATERSAGQRLARIEATLSTASARLPADAAVRLKRLRGVIDWAIHTEYDRRLTDAYSHHQTLAVDIERLNAGYDAFVRARQAATQSYEGYDETVARLQGGIRNARDTVETLMMRQGHALEAMAEEALAARRDRIAQLEIMARFAMADSYDRASRANLPDRSDP